MSSSLLGPRIAAVYELQSAWLEPRLREKGISWTTFQLLTAVNAAGEDASQIEIARRLGVTPATMSESVHVHVNKGFLAQETSATDRRKRILTLTPKAAALMGEIRTLVQECEKVMSKGVGAKDVENCGKVLDLLISRLERSLD